MESPAGVALLAVLEASEQATVSQWEPPPDSSPDAVSAAVDSVRSMTFGRLCSVAVDSARSVAGPWSAGAPALVALAYRFASDRRAIAAAIGERFHTELHAPMDPSEQQWWMSAPRTDEIGSPGPLFRDFGAVYGNGEFTWAGLWTVSDPADAAHDELIDTWELYPGPVGRWRLPVRADARVYEIHRPEDWVALVEAHPMSARRAHAGWGLPASARP